MWRGWRPGAYSNRSLWDEGGVRDIEGSGENVLIGVANGSAFEGRIENRATHLL